MKAFARTQLEKVAPKLLYTYQLLRSVHLEPEIRLLSSLCNKSKVSVDIGANKGLYSYHLLPLSSSVIAFEPLPEMVKKLRVLFGKRVTIHEIALSDCTGNSEIRLPVGNTALATMEKHNALVLAGNTSVEIRNVPVRLLDSYRLDNIGLIKIDVEGHEEAVLRGGLETIRHNKPNLIIEIEERHNKGSVQRVENWLKTLGYNGYFYDKGKVRAIKDFDPARDQNIRNISFSGKTGHYINNFIFTIR